MKFIRCTCENLSTPVKTVAGIVERNQSLPVVSNILIEQKGANVRFTTTDLDIQIQTHARWRRGYGDVVHGFRAEAR